ncbi:uncharacterized protein LOC141906962 [Tubulanus polymorphus]|uniref:uncharacterized protein LOC141906962 n=1 Tax=Tubulanus polymorphus TaxID=672921 RepID=UPI003DA2E378
MIKQQQARCVSLLRHRVFFCFLLVFLFTGRRHVICLDRRHFVTLMTSPSAVTAGSDVTFTCEHVGFDRRDVSGLRVPYYIRWYHWDTSHMTTSMIDPGSGRCALPDWQNTMKYSVFCDTATKQGNLQANLTVKVEDKDGGIWGCDMFAQNGLVTASGETKLLVVKPPRMKSRYLTSRLHNTLVIPETKKTIEISCEPDVRLMNQSTVFLMKRGKGADVWKPVNEIHGSPGRFLYHPTARDTLHCAVTTKEGARILGDDVIADVTSMVITPGVNSSLHCEVRSTLNDVITNLTWYANDKPISELRQAKKRVSANQRTALIDYSQLVDVAEGKGVRFKCQAAHSHSKRVIEEEIHITRRSEDVHPVIADAAGNELMNNEVKLNEGESTTYTCKHATGEIQWENLLENHDKWKHYSYGKRLIIRGDMTLNNSQFRCVSRTNSKKSKENLRVTVIPKPKTTPGDPTGAAGSWSRVNDTTVHMIYNYDVKKTVTCKCGNDDAIHAIRLTGNTWSVQIPDDKTCTYECTGDFNIDIENKDDTGRYFKNWRVEGRVVKWTAQQPGIVFTVAHRCKANNGFISDGNVTSEAVNEQMSLNLTFPTNMAGEVAVILKFTWKHGAETRSMEREFTFKIGKDGSTVVENSDTGADSAAASSGVMFYVYIGVGILVIIICSTVVFICVRNKLKRSGKPAQPGVGYSAVPAAGNSGDVDVIYSNETGEIEDIYINSRFESTNQRQLRTEVDIDGAIYADFASVSGAVSGVTRGRPVNVVGGDDEPSVYGEVDFSRGPAVIMKK